MDKARETNASLTISRRKGSRAHAAVVALAQCWASALGGRAGDAWRLKVLWTAVMKHVALTARVSPSASHGSWRDAAAVSRRTELMLGQAAFAIEIPAQLQGEGKLRSLSSQDACSRASAETRLTLDLCRSHSTRSGSRAWCANSSRGSHSHVQPQRKNGQGRRGRRHVPGLRIGR